MIISKNITCLRPRTFSSQAELFSHRRLFLLETYHKRFCVLFYHEAKMLARKGIFAKPSISQFVHQRDRATPKDLRSKACCGYYTTRVYILTSSSFASLGFAKCSYYTTQYTKKNKILNIHKKSDENVPYLFYTERKERTGEMKFETNQ